MAEHPVPPTALNGSPRQQRTGSASRRRKADAGNQASPPAMPSPDAQLETARRRQQQAVEPRRQEPPIVVTEPPTFVTSILHNEPWAYDFFASDACRIEAILCSRCHLVEQANLVRPQPCPNSCLLMLVISDAMTLGWPCLLYPGLGSAVFGCYTRTLIRFQYRLEGNGATDLAAMMCCPSLAAWQQHRELDKEGLQYTVPCYRGERME